MCGNQVVFVLCFTEVVAGVNAPQVGALLSNGKPSVSVTRVFGRKLSAAFQTCTLAGGCGEAAKPS